jgi:hypothetical protein
MQFSMPAPQQRQMQMSPNNLAGIMGVTNLASQQTNMPGLNYTFSAQPQQQQYRPPQQRTQQQQQYFRPQQYQQDPYMNYVRNQQQAIQQQAMQQAGIQQAQQAEVLRQQQAAQQGARLIAQRTANAPAPTYNAPDWQAG